MPRLLSRDGGVDLPNRGSKMDPTHSNKGDLFVAEIQAYAADEGLDERRVPPPRTDGNSRRGPQTGATYEETKALVLEGLNVAEIAQRRGISQQTVLNHLERLAAAGEHLELAHLMPPERRFRRIQGAFRSVGGERLTPVRDYLGDGFSFEEIRLVRLWLSQDGG